MYDLKTENAKQKQNLLFKIDRKDYESGKNRVGRTAVRGIIKRGDTYAFIHSRKYGEYKFPGGGMENGEQLEDTLAREVKEETGLRVIRETVKYLGYVEEIRNGEFGDILEMTSHYFACSTEDQAGEQKLDDYEAEYGYELEFVTAAEAIACNERLKDITDTPWVARDTAVMRRLLLQEGRDHHA